MKHVSLFCRLLMLTIAGFGLSVSGLHAQIVSGEAFLQGSFTEVGISSCGSFGTSNAAPAGYHANMGSGALGFVCDAAMDGWNVGTPNRCGDYFLPGSPEEGFGIKANGVSYNNNVVCGTNDIPGSIAAYTMTATEVSATWEGSVAGLEIEAKTSFPLGARYFVNSITICNTTASTINNVYYMRNVDPDNEQVTSGSFTTNQEIVFQQPMSADCQALVTATGTTFGCYLGLGAKDPRARVSHGGFSNRDPEAVWNATGSHIGTIGSTSTADEAISISFNLGNLAPGQCETFSFVYVLDAADLSAALDATINPQYFADGSDISTSGTAVTCIGVPVELSISNGGTYTWTWSPATGLSSTTGTTVICTPVASTTYTVTGTSPCGPPVTQTISVVAQPVPPPPSYSDVSTTCGSSATLTASSALGGTIYWYDSPSGGSLLHTGDTYITPPLSVNTTYYVQQVTACPSARVPLNVTITPLPAPAVTGDGLCAFPTAGSVTLGATPAFGGTINWYDSPSSSTVLATGNTYTTVPTTLTYYAEEVISTAGDRTWTFDSDLEDWTSVANCGFSFSWAWNSDGGAGTMFAVDPAANSSQVALSPLIDVSAVTGTVNLDFVHRFATEAGWDHGYVAFRLDGGAWAQFIPTAGQLYTTTDGQFNDPLFGSCGVTTLQLFDGNSGGYVTSSGDIDVTAASSLEIAFVMTSDGSVNADGWYIDEVNLTGLNGINCISARAPVTISISGVTADAGPDINTAFVSAPYILGGTPAAVGGSGSYSYSWSPVTGLSDPTIANPEVDPAVVTSNILYTLTVTDLLGGCTDTDEVEVIVPTGSQPQYTPRSPSCIYAIGQSKNSILVIWCDDVDNETAYEIWRSKEDANSFNRIAVVGPGGGGEMNYLDNNHLEPDTRYVYFVRTRVHNDLSHPSDKASDYTYPLMPDLVEEQVSACVGQRAAVLHAEGSHSSDRFHWYASEDATEPFLMEFEDAPYHHDVWETPIISDTTTFWVASRGHKYESEERVPITVVPRELPVASIMGDEYKYSCNPMLTLEAEAVEGAVYTWTHNTNVVATTTEPMLEVSKNGQYSVQVLSPNTCENTSDIAFVNVNYQPQLNVQGGLSPRICGEGILVAETESDAVTEWYTDGVLIGEGTSLEVNSSGVYTVVTTKYGCTKSYDITANVYEFPTDMSLGASSALICKGEETELSAPFAEGASYIWFRNGRQVRGNEANILVTDKPGTYTVSIEHSNTCSRMTTEVTVERYETPVSELTANGNTLSIMNEPGMSYSSVRWFLNNEEIPAFDGQVSINAAEYGVYYAEVTYDMGCAVHTNSIRFFGVLGTDDEQDTESNSPAESLTRIFPNPTSDFVNISLSDVIKSDVTVILIDDLGRVLQNRTIPSNGGSRKLSLSLDGYAAGVYTIQIIAEEGKIVKKITLLD